MGGGCGGRQWGWCMVSGRGAHGNVGRLVGVVGVQDAGKISGGQGGGPCQ